MILYIPFGTLLINIMGSMLVGFLLFKSLETAGLSAAWRYLMVIGFGGAFTTFSSFSVETLILMKDGSYLLAAANIFANLLLCIAAAGLGFVLARVS